MATTTTAVPRESDEFQAQAERWVADFSEGWQAPKGPAAFVEHFRSRLAPHVPQLPTLVAIERESYFDPGPLIAAIARTPRAWPKFARFQASSLAARIRERRTS